MYSDEETEFDLATMMGHAFQELIGDEAQYGGWAKEPPRPVTSRDDHRRRALARLMRDAVQ